LIKQIDAIFCRSLAAVTDNNEKVRSHSIAF